MPASYPSATPSDATLYIAKNNVSTTLNGAVDAVATTIVLTDASAFPTAGFVTIDSEAISYTGKSSNTLTGVTRGADSTTAASHSNSASVFAFGVAAHHNVLKDEIIAIATDLRAALAAITPVAAASTAADILTRIKHIVFQIKDGFGLTNWYDTIGAFVTTARLAANSVTWAKLDTDINQWGFRNKVINGNFDIWQRGTSFAAWNGYGPDRFRNQVNGAMVVTGSRDTDVPTVAQSGRFSNYSLKQAVTTVDAAIAAGEYYFFQHLVEGYNWTALAQQSFTLSFWVKAVKTGTYCVSFRNSISDRSYVAEYTINAASTWEKKTITVSASPSAGTWNYTNGVGLSIEFILAAGTTFHTATPNTWLAGNFLATANQVNGVDNVANNFWISQVQLERGSTATPFVCGSIREELSLCQRHYQKSFSIDTAPVGAVGFNTGDLVWGAGKAGVATEFSHTHYFRVRMRSAPTMVGYNPQVANGQVRDVSATADCSTASFQNITDSSFRIEATGNATTVVGNALSFHWTADAEL